MAERQYSRYQMDFGGKWIGASGALMGLSFFVRIVYYFGLMNLAQCGFAEVLFMMVLPIALCVAYVVMISALRLNAPGMYAIMGAALCILLILWSFSSGSLLRIILSVIFYGAAGVVLVGTVAGVVPGRLLAALLFLLPLLGRFFLYDLGKLGIFQWIMELSVLTMITSLFCLCWSLKPMKPRAPKEETKE